MEKPKKLITEINFFETCEKKLIVHLPILGYAFIEEHNSIELLSKLKNGNSLSADELENTLVKKLLSINAIGVENRLIPTTKPLDKFRPIEGTLLLTESCNLGCTYCYASSINSKTSPMTIDIAECIVDEVIKNARDTGKVAQFRYIGGGEPTMEWELITYITEYIKNEAHKNKVPYYIRLITNGTLLNDNRVRWISENIQFVTLSFDILPSIQNHNRPFKNGHGSQNKLIKTIKLLGSYEVPFHLRATISSEGSNRLVEMVNYVNRHLPEVKIIRFEPMAEIGRAISDVYQINSLIPSDKRNNDTRLNKPVEQQFVDSFIKAYHLGKKLGIHVTCKMMTNHLRRSTRFCNAEFSVAPDGHVAACHRYSRKENTGYDLFSIGYFNGKKFIFDIDKINQIRQIDNDSFEDCKQCFARWSCSSGCLSARVNDTGIQKTGPLCHLTRELLKFSIQQSLINRENYYA